MAYVKKIWKDYPDTTTPILASDMNNVENGLEVVDAVANSGWVPLTGTFTYSSWDSSVYTGVVNSNLDLTTTLSVGMKFKLTQLGLIKCGIITAITSTQITLFMGTDYALTNETISNVFFSTQSNPYGFNTNPDKWSIIIQDNLLQSQSSATAGVPYNIGGLAINVPIGAFDLIYDVAISGYKDNATLVEFITSLSTSNSSISDKKMNGYLSMQGAQATFSAGGTIHKEKHVEVTVPTTYYLLASASAGANAIYFRGDFATTVIKAVCAYL